MIECFVKKHHSFFTPLSFIKVIKLCKAGIFFKKITRICRVRL